jgi:uncharacterized protein (DUF302 family)
MTTETSMDHGQWRELAIGFDAAVERLAPALAKEGFGIITQVDIQQTFKAKLGVEFRRYRIFGACNPTFAHAALQRDARLGVLLPCNVVLYEKDDGTAVLGAVDPMQTLGLGGNDTALAEVAREVGARLERALDAVGA